MPDAPYIVTLPVAQQFTGADAAHGLLALDNPGPNLRARVFEVCWRSGGGAVAGDTVSLVRLEMFNPDGAAAATEVVEVRRWTGAAEAVMCEQFTVPPGWQLRFLTPVLGFEMTVEIDFDPSSQTGGDV